MYLTKKIKIDYTKAPSKNQIESLLGRSLTNESREEIIRYSLQFTAKFLPTSIRRVDALIRIVNNILVNHSSALEDNPRLFIGNHTINIRVDNFYNRIVDILKEIMSEYDLKVLRIVRPRKNLLLVNSAQSRGEYYYTTPFDFDIEVESSNIFMLKKAINEFYVEVLSLYEDIIDDKLPIFSKAIEVKSGAEKYKGVLSVYFNKITYTEENSLTLLTNIEKNDLSDFKEAVKIFDTFWRKEKDPTADSLVKGRHLLDTTLESKSLYAYIQKYSKTAPFSYLMGVFERVVKFALVDGVKANPNAVFVYAEDYDDIPTHYCKLDTESTILIEGEIGSKILIEIIKADRYDLQEYIKRNVKELS